MAGPGTLYQGGIHASRPANGAGCVLYFCSDHDLVYRDDGSTWTSVGSLTGASAAADVAITDAGGYYTGTDVEAALQEIGAGGVGGSGQAHNEVDAAVLTNGGEAIADHFAGASLDPAWGTSGSGTPSNTVGYSSLGMSCATSSFYRVIRDFAPAGAFRLEGRFAVQAGSSGVGIYVGDATNAAAANDSSGEFVVVDHTGGANVRLLRLNAGTYATVATATSVSGIGQWIYLRLDRDGSNGWTAYYSHDRSKWVQVGTTSKTMTAAKAGIRTAGESVCDFIDSVS